MPDVDISREFFYIKKLHKVIKGRNRNHFKLTSVVGRRSDAFVYVLSGTCRYTLEDGNELTVKEGDILYLAHRANYSMLVHEEIYRYIYCDFEFDSDSNRSCQVFSPDAVSCEALFVKLLNLYSHENISSYAEQLSVLYTIYKTIIKSKEHENVSPSASARIDKARGYIDSHCGDINLSVTYLADISDMSEVHFRKLFKEKYGCSPSEYITSTRLKKAMDLMKYPFLSLDDCACQSGFSSCQYFSRVFKANVGVSPAKYRKNQKKRV